MTRRRLLAWGALVLTLALLLWALKLTLGSRSASLGVVSPAGSTPTPVGSVIPTAAPTSMPATATPTRTLPTTPTSADGGTRPGRGAASVAGDSGPLPVTGPPSVSPALIDATLAREGSPLAGFGSIICAEGRHWGIDPVFLLAFVSYFDVRNPLPVAAHNVGHIRAVGAQPAVEGYHAFPTWQDGITAWYRLIHDLYIQRWGLRSLDSIVPIYAPSTPQGVAAELSSLRAMVSAWRSQ